MAKKNKVRRLFDYLFSNILYDPKEKVALPSVYKPATRFSRFATSGIFQAPVAAASRGRINTYDYVKDIPVIRNFGGQDNKTLQRYNNPRYKTADMWEVGKDAAKAAVSGATAASQLYGAGQAAKPLLFGFKKQIGRQVVRKAPEITKKVSQTGNRYIRKNNLFAGSKPKPVNKYVGNKTPKQVLREKENLFKKMKRFGDF